MQNFNGSKPPEMHSDYELSQQLKQLMHWTNLSSNAMALLKTVSARMEHSPHNAPLVPQHDQQDNKCICFDTVEGVPFSHILASRLREVFGRDRADSGSGKFTDKVCRLITDMPRSDWHHDGPYHTVTGIEIKRVIVQYKPDFSEYRLICLGRLDHGIIQVLMIRPGDCYPFCIRFDGEPREVKPEDFLFWDYNDVYREITIDTLGKTITTSVHMYNAAKIVQHFHEIKE